MATARVLTAAGLVFLLLLGVLAGVARVGRADAPAENVVYFMATPGAGYLASANVEQNVEDMGWTYVEVSTSQDVLDADAADTIDALIIDSGSVRLVDAAWVQPRYGEGMVVAGINVDAVAMQDLLGDRQITAEYEMSSYAPPAGEYWSVGDRGLRGTPYALTAIAQDPSIMEGEGELAEEDTAVRWFSFDMDVASATVNSQTYDLTAPFYSKIADGLWNKDGPDPAASGQ
jgi:hypothetical protein